MGDVPVSLLPGADDRSFQFGLSVVIASLVSALATYLVVMGMTPIVPRGPVVVTVLLINLALVAAMVAIIWVQVRGLWQGWKDKTAGGRLHARIVALFGVIAMLPAIVLAASATNTFSRSIDNVFNRQIRTIVATSVDVARSYLEEHGQLIRTDASSMAKDLSDAAPALAKQPKKFRELLLSQAGLRDLPVAYVIDIDRQVLFAAVENEKIPYEPPPLDMVQAAALGQIPLILPGDGKYRVAALVKLQSPENTFLYVARGVSPSVMRHLTRAEESVAEYAKLRADSGKLKFIHGVLYFMTALTALASAIWVGLRFASSLVSPIRRLITAAQTVARGDLSVELPIYRGEGDLRRLSQDFNHMTRQLEQQRSDLVHANALSNERRQLLQAVLDGVSAGVFNLDAEGTIKIANRSAEALLGIKEADWQGRTLDDVVPAFAPLLSSDADAARKKPQTEIGVPVNGTERTFAVRITRERQGEEDYGTVVTFDDVTDLVTAQRTSAWADIAQRIAHEIKNPLTPIQLSAERIRRKYGPVIKDDREVFDKCTDTIIRQVGDVARMVDEFSSFARMPKAEMALIDLRDAIKDPVTLFTLGSTGVEIRTNLPQAPLLLNADRRLIGQALTNLIKNACESVQSLAESKDKPEGFKGWVDVVARQDGDNAVIEIIDNGLGLPKQGRSRLLEPYVTTKGSKGTGLGLAIVLKILESHHGSLALEDAPPVPGRSRGAMMRLTLPLPRDATTAKVDETAGNAQAPPPSRRLVAATNS
jgi:two-component system, NtrC family, nitrogen regulation sensor histidine kinase NtrY